MKIEGEIDTSDADPVLNGQLDYDECPECGCDVYTNAWIKKFDAYARTHKIAMEAGCVDCDWAHRVDSSCEIRVNVSE